jgi:hypothetical protein
MKNIKFLSYDFLMIIVLALLIGLVLGRLCPTGVSMGYRTFCQKLYIKFHPDSQKDTKTIIMEKALKDTPSLPKTDIFEEPQTKDSSFVQYVKHIFVKKQTDSPKTIHDIVLQ